MSKGNTSSQSRVQPVFNWLYENDATGTSWLPTLIQLPTRTSFQPPVVELGEIRDHAWDPTERSLPAPRALLLHLVQSGSSLKPRPGRTKASTEVEAEREKILADDQDSIAKAVQLLAQPSIPPRAWYILEGPTSPDVYLRTDTAVIVIEGKNEEPKHTTRTDWMEVRYQMLRHIDGAWPNTPTEPSVFGFYIVEAEPGTSAVPAKWVRFSDETVSERALNNSLPHRSSEVRAAMARSFLGVTTWQAVCAALDVPASCLR